MWGFKEETKEVPVVVGLPASIISQEVDLCPVSPLDLDLGELEAIGSVMHLAFSPFFSLHFLLTKA